ncbi:hypothetical protein [Synechococcus phage Ssp-JY42]|nr:hypothetical protein [Synechococcus phage Yong-M4-211]
MIREPNMIALEPFGALPRFRTQAEVRESKAQLTREVVDLARRAASEWSRNERFDLRRALAEALEIIDATEGQP